MHRLVLHNLGPVKDCDINVNDFMVFTGPQASGKSTIAKAVYFFRTVKDELWFSLVMNTENETPDEWRTRFLNILTRKLDRLLFLSSAVPKNLEMTYYYTDTTSISIRHSRTPALLKPLEFSFSDSISEYMDKLRQNVLTNLDWNQRGDERENICRLFNDNTGCLFIPAGRSMISSMTSQLSGLLASLDDRQKMEIDYSVQAYLNTVQALQPLFKSGLGGLLLDKIPEKRRNSQFIEKALDLIKKILKGRYQYSMGAERFYFGPGENDYVMMKQASSGQQEAVWITNIVFYHLTGEKSIFLIVEEPESNLYPDTQKKITELLSLFRSAGNQVLITTHSPYVLGTLNNLIYASDIAAEGTPDVEKVIDRELWLDRDAVSAWHMGDGEPTPATEPEMGLIRNEYIEGASEEINREGDKLYEISAKEE